MSQEQKEVEFYAANLNAWINTKFEGDKSLLALSTGAIGLLITLISTVGVSSIESLLLHILALFSFILCLSSVLWIFRRNAKHLEDVVRGKEGADPVLEILDHAAAFSFIAGVILTSVIGLSTAINKYTEKESAMPEERNNGVPGVGIESLNGVGALVPQRNEKLSVNGVTNMKPAPQPESTPKESEEKK